MRTFETHFVSLFPNWASQNLAQDFSIVAIEKEPVLSPWVEKLVGYES